MQIGDLVRLIQETDWPEPPYQRQDILKSIRLKPAVGSEEAAYKKLAAALRMAGWDRVKGRWGGTPHWRWVPPQGSMWPFEADDPDSPI